MVAKRPGFRASLGAFSSALEELPYQIDSPIGLDQKLSKRALKEPLETP